MPLLSVIVPFGLSKERSYIEERVLQKAKFFQSDENIEFIFVEGYSSLGNNLKQIIENSGHIYLRDEEQKDYFSQGKCRNLGACFANSEVIMFLDVDCYISLDNFQKILKLIKIKNIAQNINALLVLPVVYLNKEANEMLKQYDEIFWDVLIQEDLLTAKNTWVKFFAPSSTSSLIINRHKFLELGGNNENFIGHGYEDFDLFARVLRSCIRFQKMPFNLNYDSRNWNFFDFKGFRSWFSLLGYEVCFYGIYMYHFWHIETNQNGYMDRKHKNHKLFYEHLKNLKDYSMEPLQVANVRDIRILILGDKKYNFKALSVYLGKFIYEAIDKLTDKTKEEIKSYLQDEKIDKILIDSDVVNNGQIKLMMQNYSCFYFKKGLLPNSWFFYENIDGIYKRECWDVGLDINQLEQIRVYFLSLSSKEQGEIIDFVEKLGFDIENDLYKFIFYLKNELYSFVQGDEFCQIIFNKEKILMLKNCDKVFYPLKSFVYKPYLYEVKGIKIFSKILKCLGVNFIQSIISQTKFYRLVRKLFFNPKGFFEDSGYCNYKSKKGRI